jgi:hypothetical protein
MHGSKARRWGLGGMTILVVLLVGWVAIRGKQLDPVSSTVLQTVSVVLSVYGGVVFTREGNDEHIRAVARSSVRRVMVNYSIIGRLAGAIDDLRSLMRNYGGLEGKLDVRLVDMALSGLQDQVTGQLMSADTAVQDWRDLAPRDVDEEVGKMRERQELQ